MAEHDAELDEVYGWFREQVANSFGFLVNEFGCGAKTQDEGGHGIFTRFSNRTTAVEVSYEPTDDVVEVFIIKLVNGSTPGSGTGRRSRATSSRSEEVGPRCRTRFGGAIGGRCKRHCSGRRKQCQARRGAPPRGLLCLRRAKAPQLREDQRYELRAPADPGVAKTSYVRPGIPGSIGGWIVRRLGSLVRRE